MEHPTSLAPETQATIACQWYRAATLTERGNLSLYTDRSYPAHYAEEQLTLAQRHLERWKNLAVFQDTALFQERLEADGLTEQNLLWLLAEQTEHLAQRIASSEVLQWIKELEQMLLSQEEEPYFQQGIDQEEQPITLLHVFKPLIDVGSANLKHGIEQLAATYPALPFNTHTVFHLLLPNLAARLYQAALRAVILEMHIARLEQRLSGETPQERFSHFLQQLCQRDRLHLFLLEYPVLTRSLTVIIQQWASSSLELLQRLSSDWSEIRATFAPGDEPGKLVEIQMGAGDVHRQGRSVALLRFGSGFHIVYKPRSLALDRHFQGLLDWINIHGIAHPLRPMILLDKGNYGWAEFIEAHDCATAEEVERFYVRQGYYLALLYALDAGDFHHENLLASGEHPILIDLEALFHPRFAEQNEAIVEIAATQSINHTVLRTGLLPQRTQLEIDGEGIDISGLGGKGGQLTPRPISVWKELGTDNMHMERERRAIAEEKNRPKLRGQDVDVVEYTPHILQGFEEMYRLIIKYRAEYLSLQLLPFEQDEIRMILRNTRTYGLLLAESYHPERLQDALERDMLFDHLWERAASQPGLRQVIAAERLDLEEGNIPLFTTRPASTDIFTSRGERITGFCVEPSIEFVKRRIQQMDEDDLARQQWIIKASLTTTIMEGKHHPLVPLTMSQYSEVTRRQLLQAACAVGDRLEELALRSGEGINWLGIGMAREIDEKTIWNVQALSPTKLYDGTPGVVLFLSHLGALTKEAKYTAMAQSALATIEQHVEKLLHPAPPARADHTIGAFEGLGSLIYLYSHLGILWHDSSYIARAEQLVELLDSCIEQDDRLDIIAGSAGCLCSLLSLYQVAPSAQVLAAAVQCGDHLLTCARQMPTGLGWDTLEPGNPLPGFSHGAAGIALSLLHLASASQEERFRRAALQAIAYERSLFDAEHRNWPRRLRQGGKDIPVAWCHSAPGIGLARLATLAYLDDEQIRQEIEIALDTTLKRGFGHNQSICHGDLGNLETLLVATQVLDEPRYRTDLKRLTALVFYGIQEHGWVTGVPLGVETPGLMTGLAGIGYELLRLAEPERVPSVLLLASPTGQAR